MAIDTAGQYFPDDLPQAIAYNTDGTVNTITKTAGSRSWVMTFTYAGGRMSGDSGWVPQ